MIRSLLIVLLTAACCLGSGPHVIPYDVDPPLQIDADLGDWANVPNAIVLRDKAHATYKRSSWGGPDDVSGLFGWGDKAQFDAYVYDRQGKATDNYAVEMVEREGKTYAEVRMPEGYSAAIVRESK